MLARNASIEFKTIYLIKLPSYFYGINSKSIRRNFISNVLGNFISKLMTIRICFRIEKKLTYASGLCSSLLDEPFQLENALTNIRSEPPYSLRPPVKFTRSIYHFVNLCTCRSNCNITENRRDLYTYSTQNDYTVHNSDDGSPRQTKLGTNLTR